MMHTVNLLKLYRLSFRLVSPIQNCIKPRPKIWITEALRKSSKTKAKLYKKWLATKNLQDEANYKSYRKVFRKVAAEAENMYYKSMFNYKTKSVKFSKTVME